MQDTANLLLTQHRAKFRVLALVALYSMALWVALGVAWLLRFDFAVPVEYQPALWRSLAGAEPVVPSSSRMRPLPPVMRLVGFGSLAMAG